MTDAYDRARAEQLRRSEAIVDAQRFWARTQPAPPRHESTTDTRTDDAAQPAPEQPLRRPPVA